MTYTVLAILPTAIEIWDNVSRQESNRSDSQPSSLIIPVANPDRFQYGDCVQLEVRLIPEHIPATEPT